MYILRAAPAIIAKYIYAMSDGCRKKTWSYTIHKKNETQSSRAAGLEREIIVLQRTSKTQTSQYLHVASQKVLSQKQNQTVTRGQGGEGTCSSEGVT